MAFAAPGPDALPTPPLMRAERGPWRPSGAPAVLLASGAVLVERHVQGLVAADVFGDGDVLPLEPGDSPLDVAPPVLTVLLPIRYLPLDRTAAEVFAGSTRLTHAMLGRFARQTQRQATMRAAVQLPRVEDRLLGVLGGLAERWGRVSPEGLVVPFRFTHSQLGSLVGAARPTVSLALKALQELDRVSKRPDGLLVLRPAGEEPEVRPMTRRPSSASLHTVPLAARPAL